MKIGRRGFLGLLGAAVVGAHLPKIAPEPISINCSDVVIGQWAEYTNVSDLAFQSQIDPLLAQIPARMAFNLAISIEGLIAEQRFAYLREAA